MEETLKKFKRDRVYNHKDISRIGWITCVCGKLYMDISWWVQLKNKLYNSFGPTFILGQ